MVGASTVEDLCALTYTNKQHRAEVLFSSCLHPNRNDNSKCFISLNPLTFFVNVKAQWISPKRPAHPLVWWSARASTAVSPPLPYFGMQVAGICSNSSHPVGIGMSTPLLPSVFTAPSLSISPTPAHVWSSRPGRPAASARRTAHTFYWLRSQLNHFQVALEAGKPQLRLRQLRRQEQLGGWHASVSCFW